MEIVRLPTGTVTFLFTDIVGSTDLAQKYPSALPTLLARHHAILREAIEAHNGFVFQIIGDAFHAAFFTASEALNAAVDAQRLLLQEPWNPTAVKVRMGINTGAAQPGAAEERSWGYTGYLTLTRVERVMSVANGGQILLSTASAELVRGELPEGLALRDMHEHRLKGLLNPERLWQVDAPFLPHDFPPLASLNAIPNNLPLQLTSFIGREHELNDIKRLLGKTRLLTLTGAGGSGKTRVSLQVAADVIDEFENGAWFVEIAPLTDPTLIPQTVASVLGLREEQGRPLTAILSDYLHTKTALIILDNCEHLIEGCALFADMILHAAPKVKILTSSREALNIGGEVTYRVPSLAVPDPQHVPSVEALTQYDAVRLFIERAKGVLPSFEVNNANAPALAQICYHLDGIPLAIELAASRVRGMKVEQIAQRLDDRFHLLTSGGRRALPRHQTLRAMIDWSHSLLSDQERILFRRVSVFAGGWTIEAAEAVCMGNGIESSEILGVLLHLVDKSLVIVDDQGEETRYRMLETIREYARDRLLETNEVANVQNHHLAFFLQFAAKDEPGPAAENAMQWRDRLESELDNLRTALDWSLKNNVESGLLLAGVVGHFYWMTLHYREGLDWLGKFLALSESTSHTRERAKTLLWAGVIQRLESWDDPADTQRLLRSRVWLEESLAIYQELGHQAGAADSLYELGFVMESQDDLEAARELYTESVRISQEVGYKFRAAVAINKLGDISALRGDRTQARRLYEEALRIYRTSKVKRAQLWPLGNLGNLALQEGDLTAARSYSEESLALHRESNQERNATWVLLNLGEIAARQGRYDEAREYIERSMAFRQELGMNIGLDILALAFLAYTQSDYSQAEELYRRALRLLRAIKLFAVYALDGLARVVAMQSRAARAITLFGAAAALREAIGMPPFPIEQADNERGIATARAQLDETTFQNAWDEGRVLTMEQAIELALSDEQ